MYILNGCFFPPEIHTTCTYRHTSIEFTITEFDQVSKCHHNTRIMCLNAALNKSNTVTDAPRTSGLPPCQFLCEPAHNELYGFYLGDDFWKGSCTHWCQKRFSGPECLWQLLTRDRFPPPPCHVSRSPPDTDARCRVPWSALACTDIITRTLTLLYCNEWN